MFDRVLNTPVKLNSFRPDPGRREGLIKNNRGSRALCLVIIVISFSLTLTNLYFIEGFKGIEFHWQFPFRDVCNLVHEHGGQVYLDGANMNAQVSLLTLVLEKKK